MFFQKLRFTFWLALLTFALTAPMAMGQDGGDGGDGGDDPVDDTGNLGGVEISPDGVFQSKLFYDLSGDLDRQRFEAAQRALNKDVQKPSKLRKISLNRLEAAYKALKETGKPIPPEMNFLAGITRLTHVFYYPETKDIVLAGPAEGFFRSSQDRIIGMKTGQATLQLEDLIVALRAFAPNKAPTGVISCSIDPTQQGLANLNQAVVNAQNQINANGGFAGIAEKDIAGYFQQAMGLQKITVKGVSPKTHFAQVLVDADYHMKLIGIGLEQPPVRISSFIQNATAGNTSTLQRWFFQPDYDYVKVTDDELAMHLDGGGVKLVGEAESVTRGGQRHGKSKSSRASRMFTTSFTKMYGALAEKMPLYAELRNVIDMSVAAAFIQEMDFYGQADWNMNYFGNESNVTVEKYHAPTKIAPAINAVWKNGLLMTPIGGGVNIQPRVAISSDRMKTDESGEIAKVRKSINVSDLKTDQWWWD